MGFIVNTLIRRPHLINNNVNNVNMLINTTIYNPIIGSNLGIPLNILQYVFTTTYYHENIITNELILLQFAIGIFTYGTDRLLDAINYNKYENKLVIYSDSKVKYYDYLIKNINENILLIIASYIYILNLLKFEKETYPLLIALTTTLFYRDFKKNFGILKPLYIGFFWTLGCVILPCVIHDNNYNILYHPNIYLPNFCLMFASSNMLDIKDIEEDKEENIKTLAVLLGEDNTNLLSNTCNILGLLIYLMNFS
tara:strand:+ start:167 stop:925 length:759 start_codon:yes stop_codon:yes gene_type:complete